MIILRQLWVYWIQASVFCLLSSMAFAQTFDQSYQSWKTQQQAHDQRLNASSSADYDRRKQTLHKDASKNSASKSSKKKHTGNRINLNTATVLELQQLNGVGEKKAKAIVDYRNQNGGFKAVTDLLNIKGIGPKFIEKNQANLDL